MWENVEHKKGPAKWPANLVAGLANLNDDCSIAGHALPLESNGFRRMFKTLQRDLKKKNV